VGTTEVIIQNTPLQMKTQKVEFAGDDAESIRSDGVALFFEINGNDELILSPTLLYPNTPSGLTLGAATNEFLDAYIAGTINLFTDQAESIRSDGTDIIWEVGGSDEMQLSPTVLYPTTNAGLSLGSDLNEWLDIWIDGTGYFDAITMHGALNMNTQNITNAGTITGTSINTGLGNFEIGQDLDVGDNVTFNQVSSTIVATGGANFGPGMPTTMTVVNGIVTAIA